MNDADLDKMRRQIIDHHAIKAVTIPKNMLWQQFENLKFVFNNGPVYGFFLKSICTIVSPDLVFDQYVDSYNVVNHVFYQIYVHKLNYEWFNSVEQLIDFYIVCQVLNE